MQAGIKIAGRNINNLRYADETTLMTESEEELKSLVMKIKEEIDGRESEWSPGVGDGQGGLACCNSQGRKELDTTERLNWTELNWKAGLKLNIQKTKIMASGPITSCQKDGETMETVKDFFLASKITADGDCNHEVKRHLLLGRKAMINLDSILKSKDITLPTNVHLVKAMFFSTSYV